MPARRDYVRADSIRGYSPVAVPGDSLLTVMPLPRPLPDSPAL